MKIEYFFASDKGDIPVEQGMLESPFVTRPLETHPYLTLGNFFDGVRDFFLENNNSRLLDLLGNMEIALDPKKDIQRFVLRYEKYGTLYHILSLDIVAQHRKEKLAVSIAQFKEAKETLNKEYELLAKLKKKSAKSYIQTPYLLEDLEIAKGSETELFSIMCSNWFEGFHEWHFKGDKDSAKECVIWDMIDGYKSLSLQETGKLIQAASKILTIYYDPVDFYRIHPWHHGAGDFVAKVVNKKIDVRLISIRGYEPLTMPAAISRPNPLEAILMFFLEMCIKMRVDKYEGMGDPVWAGDFILPFILEGFLEGLSLQGEFPKFDKEKVIPYFKSLSQDLVFLKATTVFESHKQIDPTDFNFINKHLKNHVARLSELMKGL